MAPEPLSQPDSRHYYGNSRRAAPSQQVRQCDGGARLRQPSRFQGSLKLLQSELVSASGLLCIASSSYFRGLGLQIKRLEHLIPQADRVGFALLRQFDKPLGKGEDRWIGGVP